ncbi:ABC transporter substrate-binding protein [Brucella sp. NBRC 12950]|uniref:ABC transporter substrate-binding protein n=1 Tax=Brucella sp. NBRC 12950 TaxID=2994518 RepID=UPI0024A4D373|nr:ABC transporter substrate-binding protein [Brucella sp. NBRC 12950]GLU29076.1 nitrate ABC transporter substrate-binding protein [Brucella sp. NBRC 12950]
MKMFIKNIVAVAAAVTLSWTATSAQAKEIRIAGGVGVLFAPIHIMKQAQLVEKHAKESDADFTLSMLSFPSGSAVNDALLSGNVDIVAAGVSNALLLWSRTGGDIKALAAVSGTKSVLVSKDPNVKTLKDFKDTNRISVTSLKISNQAIYLQMALDKEFGDPKKFDPMMVQLGFADGVQSMLNPKGPTDAMFAGPPYYQQLLKQPDFHAVLTTLDVAGPTTNLLAFTTSTYHNDNPEAIKVFLAALADAQQMINDDPKKAAELYLQSTGEKFTVDELAAMFAEEGNIFQSLPLGVHQTAAFIAKIGLIKHSPESWKDFFFADLHNVPGADAAN